MLSICIPSYNRKIELNNLIKNLLNLLIIFEKSYYEIIVVENGIKTLDKSIIDSNNEIIKYKCNEENLGFSRNVKEVIKLASKKYIWLLSDNDLIDELNLKLFLKQLFNGMFDTDIINIPFSETKNGLSNFVINMNNPFEHLNKGELPFMLMSSIIFKNKHLNDNNYLENIPDNIYLQNIILYENVGHNPTNFSFDKILLHYTFEKDGRFFIVKGHLDFCEILNYFSKKNISSLLVSKKMNFHYCQMLIFEHFANKRTLVNIKQVINFFKFYRYIYPFDFKFTTRTLISCIILQMPIPLIKIFSKLIINTSEFYNKLK